MATVYRGVHLPRGQPCAVKVLLPALAADAVLVERFKSEARIASQLRHPNIVAIHEIGEAQGRFFLVMDLVDGTSLGRLLRRETTLALDRTVRLLEQLASALDHAHSRGVIHRDVKPANVLIGANDHVSLLDFGVARAVATLDRLTKPGLLVGTPEYLAPEVVSGGASDHRADLYSLGVLAFEMLAGRLPFTDSDAMAVLYAQVYRRPPSLRALRPDLPPAVEQVVMRQLEKAPEDRFQTAGAFVAALRRAALLPGERGTPLHGGTAPFDETLDGREEPATPAAPPRGRHHDELPTPRPVERPPLAEPPGGATIPPLFPLPGPPPAGRGSDPPRLAPLPVRPRAIQPRTSPAPAPSRARLVILALGVLLIVAGLLASGRLGSLADLASLAERGATPTISPATPAPEPSTATPVLASIPTAVPTVAAPTGVPPGSSAPSPGAAPTASAAPAPSPAAPAGSPVAAASPGAAAAPPAPSPQEQLAQALAHIEGRDFSSALVRLAALKQAAPETEGLDDALYRAHLGYGQELHERGLLDESYAEYGEALKLRADDPAALDGQKQVVLTKLWNTMEAAWDQDNAVATAALEEILVLDPGYRDANVKLYALLVADAKRQLAAGAVEPALALLARAHEVYPEGDEARVLLETHAPSSEPTPEPAAEPMPTPARPARPAPQPQRPGLPGLPSLPGLPPLPFPRP